ncbi:hypothetical protein G7Y79_00024g055460 [Physcia stellaris]|nr:hypothetical protein G7Y79_00024g055460 [Physcia stellaris]
MFLLPWSTAASEKVLPEPPKLVPPKPLSNPMSHVPLFNKQKRKRDSSGNEARSPKRRHEPNPIATSISANPVAPPILEASQKPVSHAERTLTTPKGRIAEGEDASQPARQDNIDKASSAYDIMNSTPLQQTIESQFSLEILLKHRELRLIDQELAKCQVALEQLRRCEIMPYPASSSDPNVMAMASSGTGPSYSAQTQSSAPWGVTEGPYARHYAQWLIPDPAFGDSVSEQLRLQLDGTVLPDRATRGSMSTKSHGASTRAQRGSAREKLHALPHGYPEPKEDKGPMIVKRSTDGHMVKLVCLDCRRENFNSAQGFINHCRIAHSRGFASHDAAAIACGEEVEADAPSSVPGGSTGQINPAAGLVHPLIRSALLTNATPQLSPATQQRRKRAQSKVTMSRHSGKSDGTNDIPSAAHAGPSSQLDLQSPFPFKPSPHTPHLSALFAKTGRGGDLDEMVTEAMRKPEPETPLTEYADDEDEDVEESIEQPESRRHGTLGVIRGGGRLPARSGMSPAPSERTPTLKSAARPTPRRPDYLNTFAPSSAKNEQSFSEPTYVSHPHHCDTQTIASPPITSPTLNLSPNTLESHQAPSLVSDDGDYGNTHSDFESETPSSAIASDDEDTFEVEVKDSEQQMDLDAPSGSSGADYGLSSKPHHHAPQSARPRPSALVRRHPAERGSSREE